MPNKTNPGLDAAYNLDSPDANRSLYKNWAATYDEDFARQTGYRFARLIAQAFLDAGGQGPLLDVGCGTGLVADHLPSELIIDGVDISTEMLAEAERKGHYRALIEADLTVPLATIADATYAGLTSAGTFTHGHVGPQALHELMRVLQPGAVCSISGKRGFFEEAGFQEVFDGLADRGIISPPSLREERVYESGANIPEGHENDTAYVIVFKHL